MHVLPHKHKSQDCCCCCGNTALLLDLFPGAAAAYSVRKLRSDYEGAAMRVRRSSDNAELDIFFDGVDLDTAALLTFVGAGDGFVTTWYDQSAGNNAVQITAANQPRIVSGGVLVTINSISGIDWGVTGTTRLISTSLVTTQPETLFSVVKYDVISSDLNAIVDSYNNVSHILRNRIINSLEANAGNSFVSASTINTNQNLITTLYNGTSSVLGLNGGSEIGNSGTNGFSGLSIGNVRGNPTPIAGNFNLEGKIQELVVYGSNETANRASIETNINDYYGIF